jgi:hypothetical protein
MTKCSEPVVDVFNDEPQQLNHPHRGPVRRTLFPIVMHLVKAPEIAVSARSGGRLTATRLTEARMNQPWKAASSIGCMQGPALIVFRLCCSRRHGPTHLISNSPLRQAEGRYAMIMRDGVAARARL